MPVNYCVACVQEGDALGAEPEFIQQMLFFLNNKLIPPTGVYICPDCGYVWLDPRINPEELRIYYGSQDRLITETVAYKEQMAFLERFIKFPNIRVLDIGSFDNRFLELAAKAGAETTNAVEPDPKHSGNGFRTIEDAINTVGANFYNLITMGHVFEHVQDPVRVLEQCKYLLQLGGSLFIEVPDLADPQIQVVPFWTPFHQSYFTSDTLTYMLERAGFKIVGIEFTGYRAIRVLARCFTLQEANLGDRPPPHSAVVGVEMYRSKRSKFIEELRDRLSWVEHENLAIFGAGDHTRWLLRFFPDLKKNLKCILDSSLRKQSEGFEGRPVLAPDDCPDSVDRIIISSYDTQDEMATIAGKRAMMLYDDVRAYDVWLGE